MKKNIVFSVIAIISIIMLLVGCFIPDPYALVIKVIAAIALFVLGILKWVVPKKDNTIVRLIILITLFLALLTWIIPTAQANGAEIVDMGLSRLSIYNFVEYPYIAFQFFFQSFSMDGSGGVMPLIFIGIVGGFYGILAETGKFRNKLEKIAKSMKGKGTLFIVLVTMILAALSSVFGMNLMMFIFIPALCGIILLMGYDKITAFASTFMAPIIGVIGSTYSVTVTGYINQVLGTDNTTEIIAKIALLVLSYLIYIAFLIKHANKSLKQKEENKEEEVAFLGEKKQSKKAFWPIAVVFGILLVLIIIGCTPWYDLFQIEAFNNFHTWLTELTIGEHTIISYLIGDLGALGTWHYAEIVIFLLMATVLICAVYKLSLQESINAFGKGIVKTLKPALIVVLSYVVVIITVYHPFLLTVTDWIVTGGQNLLNLLGGAGILAKIICVVVTTIVTILSSVLNIETLFVLTGTAPYLAAVYADYTNTLAIITQSVYGITSLIAPTSIMLILGLEYLHISYKDWLKSSWKLVLSLLLLSIVISLIVIFI